MITDGASSWDAHLTIPTAERIHQTNTRVIVLGVSNEINEAELQAMSSPPHAQNMNFWIEPNFPALHTIAEELSKAVCP